MGAWDSIRRHPVVSATVLLSSLAGAVLGFYLLADDWSAARRIVGGAVAGAGAGLLVTATSMYAR